MSNDNEAYFAWRQSLQPFDRALQRANAEASNALSALNAELRAGRPTEARAQLAEVRAVVARQRHALDAWISAIDVDAPDRRP